MAIPVKTLRAQWLVIALKELRETFKERRTLMAVVVGPLVITPLLFSFTGKMMRNMTNSAQTKQYSVGILGKGTNQVRKQLAAVPNIKVFDVASKTAAEQWIKDRRIGAAVELPANFDFSLAQQHSVPVSILEDEGNQDSQIAAGQVEAVLNRMGNQELSHRLKDLSLSADFIKPFAITREPIATGGSKGTFVLAMFLPYILALTALTGSMYSAFDQVAGEKERNTLETLLVSPASRRDIVLGKFITIVCVCMLSSLLSVIGLLFSMKTGSFGPSGNEATSIHLGPTAAAAIVLVMLPQAVLFAGILLGISTFARNQKEAQTYISPLMMVLLLPVLASLFLGPSAPLSSALVPVLGSAIIIKQALNESFNLTYIVLAFGASIIYAGLALAISVHLFQKESVLIKT